MMLRCPSLLFQLLCIAPMVLSGAARAEVPFPAVDLPCTDSAFASFRATLTTATANRDRSTLLPLLSPTVTNSFGSDGGIKEFDALWNPASKSSRLWSLLEWILNHGGQCRDNASFEAPYIFSAWPDDLDPFENVAIVGRNVRVRASPNLASATIAMRSHTIVRLEGENPYSGDWVRVSLDTGAVGYVSGQYARSAVGYRLMAARSGNEWRITALVAGD